jgi:ferritin-like metal-binding protein YciE
MARDALRTTSDFRFRTYENNLNLSMYEPECQIWKTFTMMFTEIDPNKKKKKKIQYHNKESLNQFIRLHGVYVRLFFHEPNKNCDHSLNIMFFFGANVNS